ncbi:response regulator transcription factor [Lentzea sp. NPDC006480]|uniref:response regulator transcription factor n=1 Tax=Lentzea sp. NPDC006480 TaxID=3157176 RepID=UPI0033BB3C1F
MTKIRLVIGDAQYLRREGLRRMFADCVDTETVAVVADPEAMAEAVDVLKPDAVLTSICARAVRLGHPDVGVVVLQRDARIRLDLLRHSTARVAYLLEDDVRDFDEILWAVREVVAGRTAVNPLILEAVVRGTTPITTLTARELDVVRHMSRGRTNRAIAELLTVTESTVEKHVNTAFAKLGLGEDPRQHRRVAAVLAYLRHQARNVREIPSLRE